jgi:uncharacterized protein (TIGR00290 family)
MTRVAVSWSGGKDSCLACYKAMLDGMEVSYLINFVSKDERCMSHGLDAELIVAQSQAIGIPIIQREVTWDTYEEEFKAVMKDLKQTGVKTAVFGDIIVQEHKDWVDRVCSEVGIQPIEPLWGLSSEQVLREFINEGFKAIVVKVKADIFGKDWLERKIDRCFIEDLRRIRGKHNVDFCGEFGEYHTLVVDGPIFNRRLRIVKSEKVLKEGYWRCWLLEIHKYTLEEKVDDDEENL